MSEEESKIQYDVLHEYNVKILSDSLLAIFGAIFLDSQSIPLTCEFINRVLIKHYETLDTFTQVIDSERTKLLQEWAEKPYFKGLRIHHET
jgi:dsRNA-specific ribonuclease